MVKKGLSIEKDLCIQGIFLPCWCRIHNTTHSKVTCPLYRGAIYQAKVQGRLEESLKMYIIEKWWNADLQTIELASNEEGITATSCSEENTIDWDHQHNSIKRKFAYLMSRKQTLPEVEVDKEIEYDQTNASNDSTIKQEEMPLDDEVHSCMLQMEEMISGSRWGGICDSQWDAKMEVECEMEVRSVLEPLPKIQEELLK